MKPVIVLAVLLVLLPAILLAGQVSAPSSALTISAKDQFALAESLFSSGDINAALTEYHRFVFFFPEDLRAPHAALRIGQCQMRLGDTDKAVAALLSVADRYPGTPPAMTALFLVSDIYERSGRTAQALINLRNMMQIYRAPGIQDRIRYRMAWTHIEEGRWDEADRMLAEVGPVGRSDLPVAALSADLKNAGSIDYKNPTLAGTFSLIPGGGQLYCGRHRDALVAFLVNGGLIWAAVESFDNELYALGAVISVVEFGFYAGNIYGAVGSAHKYNDQRKRDFIDNLKLRFTVTGDPISRGTPPSPALGISLSFRF